MSVQTVSIMGSGSWTVLLSAQRGWKTNWKATYETIPGSWAAPLRYGKGDQSNQAEN